MAEQQPAGTMHLSREQLRGELERAREQIADLEADRWHSHERLIDSLAQHLQDGFALLTPTGVHLDVNAALCEMSGFTREELVGVGLPHPYWPPEDRESIVRDLLRHVAGATDRVEATFMRKNGARFPVLITPSVMRDAQGEPICVLATIKDIGEQKRAEEALRASEARYRGLVDGMLEGLAYCRMITDDAGQPRDWLYLAVNPAFERLTELHDVLGKRISELLPQTNDEAPELLQIYGRVAAGGPPEEFEIDFTPLGRIYHVSAFCPAAEHFVAVFEDVTESRRLEQQNALLRRSIDVHADGAYWSDAEGRFTFVNEAAATMLGYAREELIGQPISLINPAATPARLAQVWARLRSTGSFTTESVHRRKDGSQLPVEITSSYVTFAGKEYNCGFAQDISTRKAAETALRASEQKYRCLFENAEVGMFRTRLDGSAVLDANERFLELLGRSREEVLGAPSLMHWVDPGEREKMLRRLEARGHVTDFECRMLSADGAVRTCLTSLSLDPETGILEGSIADISERKAAENVLREGEARLQRALAATIAALGATVAMRDPYTANHERRVAALACRMAARLGWSEGATETLHTAALVHDIGKITVPAEILSKPTRLTEAEFALIKAHAAAAHDILAPIDFGGPVAEMVYQHHERLDGSGYPRGLRGDQILPEARVLAVADVVEAMITHRPYRPALPLAEALAEIGPGSRGRYDQEAAEACRQLLEEEGFTLPE